MNDHHKRAIAITYRHIDELLREAAAALSDADKDSPFSRIVLDAAPVQHRVIADYTRRVRALMLQALRRLDIPVETPAIPATKSVTTNLIAAHIDLEELDPKRLQGYGPLSPEDAVALTETNAEIQTVLEQMRAYLSAGADADLEARAARAGLPSELGDALRLMAQLVTDHGLVVLRPAVARLVEESESARFEIAVFGRVSSGKSSLLNYMVARPVLPVGVTPVTTLVTRIGYGPQERVTVRFAADPPLTTTVEELAAFVTEQENPSNRKHVTSVQIELPEERLRDGAVFVDTPGLGSLATAGASETMAYLPRADLGILLADATAPLAPQDVALVEGLVRSGARAMVVLSKADLLRPEDRPRVQDYVATHLAKELGYELPVHWVSVVGADAALAEAWFEGEIRPLLAVQQELKRRSLARKAEILRRSVLEALRVRLEALRGRAAPPETAPSAQAEEAYRRTLGAFDEALETCREAAHRVSEAAEGLLAEAAGRIAASRTPEEAAGILEEVVRDGVRRYDQRVLEAVERARQAMARTLAEAAGSGGSAAVSAQPPPLSGLPLFDGAEATRALALRGSPLGFFGARAREAGVLAQLRAQVERPLREALVFHKQRLEKWCQRAIQELRDDFQARTGLYRIQSASPAAGPAAPGEMAALMADVQKLEALGSPDTAPRDGEAGAAGERPS